MELRGQSDPPPVPSSGRHRVPGEGAQERVVLAAGVFELVFASNANCDIVTRFGLHHTWTMGREGFPCAPVNPGVGIFTDTRRVAVASRAKSG